jgi:hypothetical protein
VRGFTFIMIPVKLTAHQDDAAGHMLALGLPGGQLAYNGCAAGVPQSMRRQSRRPTQARRGKALLLIGQGMAP